MCLVVIVDKPAPTERMIIYKAVLVWQDKLIGPFYKFDYKAGFNQAIGEPKIEKDLVRYHTLTDKREVISKIGQGIFHCYYDKLTAIDFAENYGSKPSEILKVLEGYGESEDFVAWGVNGEIGFKRIYIPQEEIAKVLKC